MKWFQGPIHSAIAEAKISRKIFLVFVEGDDEASKIMSSTYNETAISDSLKDDCVAIRLDTKSDEFRQFSLIYPVIIVPSSFFIGIDGIPLEVVGGKVSIEEFQDKLEKVLQMHKSKVSKFEGTNKAESSQSVSNPSEDDPDAPFDDKVERAKQLIEERRLQKQQEQQMDEKRKEMEKRRVGKELQKFKEDQQKKEMLSWAQERQKEKQEDKLARERIKAQIAQDRADRAARFSTSPSSNPETSSEAQSFNSTDNIPVPSSSSNRCRIQFRLPDASTRTHEFEATDKMNSVFGFVQRAIGFSNVTLATTFPRRQFTKKENGSRTLRDLELVPSAVLIIIPNNSLSGTSLSTGRGAGTLFSMLYSILTPLFLIWNFFLSFFGRGSGGGGAIISPPASNPNPRNRVGDSSNRPVTPSVPSTSRGNGSDNNHPSSSNSDNSSPSSQRYRRDGNIHRLANESQDDDDENNTWNGNSTQQL